jgi:hypothetical protein
MQIDCVSVCVAAGAGHAALRQIAGISYTPGNASEVVPHTRSLVELPVFDYFKPGRLIGENAVPKAFPDAGLFPMVCSDYGSRYFNTRFCHPRSLLSTLSERPEFFTPDSPFGLSGTTNPVGRM